MSKLKRKHYEELLGPMQRELVAMARWAQRTGQRVVVVVEGRDTAGKGGTIDAIRAHINPRQCGWWLCRNPPTASWGSGTSSATSITCRRCEIALFDRSWYNRAGVEKVMATRPMCRSRRSCGKRRCSNSS